MVAKTARELVTSTSPPDTNLVATWPATAGQEPVKTPVAQFRASMQVGTLTAAGVTFENLSANGDVGTGAAQVAQGNHNHSGLYQPLNGDLTALAALVDPATTLTTALQPADVGTAAAADLGNGEGELIAVAAGQTPNGAKFLRDDGVLATPGGSGDMTAAVYDPTAVADDAFDMENMVEGTTAKILTATERTKLAGVATGATANSTDAQLRDRATHTGTQTLSTISDAGGAAALNVGTGAGTVAAGDHNHTGVYQPADADLTALAAAGNSGVLSATTASFLTADETKLDGIEAGADVTDATNVAAAGAHMVGGTDIPVADGGTGASTAALARNNLGLTGLELTYLDKTGDFTLALTDAYDSTNGRKNWLNLNHATAITMTVPANATVAFPVGTVLLLSRVGAGTATIAAAGGVTVNKPSDKALTLRMQYSPGMLRKTATDVWTLSGDLT